MVSRSSTSDDERVRDPHAGRGSDPYRGLLGGEAPSRRSRSPAGRVVRPSQLSATSAPGPVTRAVPSAGYRSRPQPRPRPGGAATASRALAIAGAASGTSGAGGAAHRDRGEHGEAAHRPGEVDVVPELLGAAVVFEVDQQRAVRRGDGERLPEDGEQHRLGAGAVQPGERG
ncbi:hypothetical protein [Pseudonocardia sp. ICBG601]|uniref:hypothetical protein n=1 Tax=Pseudonocardia sp. ICBG601 TaxID=2846759 RepID=UPI001CF71423|nr:hypothetical protein [Pseudonocardia sp. ICBG601]